jgi:hypothetical protein
LKVSVSFLSILKDLGWVNGSVDEHLDNIKDLVHHVLSGVLTSITNLGDIWWAIMVDIFSEINKLFGIDKQFSVITRFDILEDEATLNPFGVEIVSTSGSILWVEKFDVLIDSSIDDILQVSALRDHVLTVSDDFLEHGD